MEMYPLSGGRNTKISIGEDCLFASKIKFRASDSHTVYDVSNREEINHSGDIIVGNHVWIGGEVTFLKNSQIMDDSVVGTKSLVTKCFKEHNLCVEALENWMLNMHFKELMINWNAIVSSDL